MSTWYSDGTIEVAEGGDVAAGTGTAFLANVRVGDGIAIAGSATLHEVTNIASNQQLTFQPPFAGQAGSALAYRIAPVQGYVKRAADRLAQIVAEYGDTLAALGDEETRQLVIELAENITPAGLELMGKATAAEQLQVLSLDRVDNTPDAEKPVSAPQLQALDAKADAEDVATALTGKADAEQTAQALAGKVDKEAGKGLSHNDLTDELYDKLASIEGSRWQGVYISLEALATAKPVGEPGWFAWVDAGEGLPVKMAIWDIDDQQWRISSGEGGTMTPAQVLEALKANPDVNVLTDAQRAKLVETLVFTQAQKDKLDSIQAEAQKNPDAATQAEAESGTATALRSWAPNRLWHAITAAVASWWAGSSMKAKLDTLPAAPVADGKTYALKDRAWAEFQAAGSALIKETRYTQAGTINHTFDQKTSVYVVEIWGAGGGAGTNSSLGVAGGDTTFGTLIARGGGGGGNSSGAYPGKGGTATGGLVNLTGQQGGVVDPDGYVSAGGASPLGGSGGFGGATGVSAEEANGSAPGGGGLVTINARAGGGGGGYSRDRKSVIGGATISGVVGAGGTSAIGGNGAPGEIRIREYSSNLPGVDVVNQLISEMSAVRPTRVAYSGSASPIALGTIPADANKVTITISGLVYAGSTNVVLEMDDGSGNWLPNGVDGSTTVFSASGVSSARWSSASNMIYSGSAAGTYSGKITLEKTVNGEWVMVGDLGNMTAVYGVRSVGKLPGTQSTQRSLRITSSSSIALTATVKVEK